MTLREGDVLHYIADDEERHCREWQAVINKHGAAVDTFWGTSACGEHVLTPTELHTAVVRFNLADYNELDQFSPQSESIWSRYAPCDRETITSQHGLRKRLFIHKEAVEDLVTQVEAAQALVVELEHEAELAERRVKWSRKELAELLTRRGGM